MRKANFDISHELDEFLMVEKPLTATKRKQNVDYDKLKPEYRQLEEQSVTLFFLTGRLALASSCFFLISLAINSQIYELRLHETQTDVLLPTQSTDHGCDP